MPVEENGVVFIIMKRGKDVSTDFVTSLHVITRIRKKHENGIGSERSFAVAVVNAWTRHAVHRRHAHHVVGTVICGCSIVVFFHPRLVPGMSIRAEEKLIGNQICLPQMPEQTVMPSLSDVCCKTVTHPGRIRILRQIAVIGIYGIFIVFVVSGVRSNVKNRDRYQEQQTNQEPEVSEPTKKYSDLDNYEYDLVITRDTNVLTYQGKHADEVDLFIDPSTNQAYYLEQSVLYQVVNGVKQPVATPIQEIDITKLTPTMIQTLLDESTLDYTKQYASGIEEKQYILSLPHTYLFALKHNF